MFPAEWSVRSHGKRRRGSVAGSEAAGESPLQAAGDPKTPRSGGAGRTAAQQQAIDDRAASETLHVIRRSINTAAGIPMTPSELNLDVILSRVPFRTMVNGLFSSDTYEQPSVPVVVRAYEEHYLREPTMASERPCAAGAMCECMFIDLTNPFTGVEFVVPGETPKESSAEFCVLCSRKVTQKLFYDIVLARKEVHGVIQRYGNLCGVQGEYARECMLICPPGGPLHNMPLPIMSHQRNKYQVRVVNGVRTLVQLKVGFEDFPAPSASSRA